MVPETVLQLFYSSVALAASVTVSAEAGNQKNPDDPFTAVITAEKAITTAIVATAATTIVVIAAAEEQ